MTLQNRINPQGLFNEKVCESALFHQKNESYPQRGAENAQKDAVASKVYLTFDATAPLTLKGRIDSRIGSGYSDYYNLLIGSVWYNLDKVLQYRT